MLCWKLGAVAKPGCITRTEFLKSMESLGFNQISNLKDALPTFDPGFLEDREFREFYRFVFQFSREGTNKTIGMHTKSKNNYLFFISIVNQNC